MRTVSAVLGFVMLAGFIFLGAMTLLLYAPSIEGSLSPTARYVWSGCLIGCGVFCNVGILTAWRRPWPLVVGCIFGAGGLVTWGAALLTRPNGGLVGTLCFIVACGFASWAADVLSPPKEPDDSARGGSVERSRGGPDYDAGSGGGGGRDGHLQPDQ